MHQPRDLAEPPQPTAATSLLRTLSLELGDRRIEEQWWDSDDDWELAAVPSALWQELEQSGLLCCRHWLGKLSYRLTLPGWVAGMDAAGTFRSDVFRARCSQLVTYLTAQIAVQSSSRGAVVSTGRLEADGFASGWVLNILRSDLLKHVFPDRCMNARWDPGLQNVRVPLTFGSLFPQASEIDDRDVVDSA